MYDNDEDSVNLIMKRLENNIFSLGERKLRLHSQAHSKCVEYFEGEVNGNEA